VTLIMRTSVIKGQGWVPFSWALNEELNLPDFKGGKAERKRRFRLWDPRYGARRSELRSRDKLAESLQWASDC